MAPPGTSAKAAVTATATGKHPAELIWGWLRATDPLHGSGQNFVEFAVRARPEWALDTLGEELQNRKQAHRSELERRRAAKEKGHAAHGND
ncbi:hypothetical protein A9X05_21340 [Mycobacterium sp. E3298]|nr:hypothetical protein A5701_23555 [Mycobacterium sp. E3305]OBG79896.1 hypothetical protein A9X05_21340 [Mycobacterium sp. E3298]